MSTVESEYDAHRELLQSIRAVDHAPPTFAQVKSLLATTVQEEANEKQRLRKLELETKKEFRDWKDIQDRATKRLWVKIKHPSSNKEILSAMEAKEEKEYLEAFGKEQNSKARIAALQTQRADLTKQVDDLQPLVVLHDGLRKQLEALYQRVFDGPTPQFPEEDGAEWRCKEALQRFNEIQTGLTNERRARDLVLEAAKLVKSAIAHMQKALDYSTWDVMGGGMWADMMERSAIADAQRALDQAKMMNTQARALSPELREMPQLEMPQGNFLSDIMFDNIFSDLAFHQDIKDALAGLCRFDRVSMPGVVTQAQDAVAKAESAAMAAGANLERSRDDLERIRQEIMETRGQAPIVNVNGVSTVPDASAAPPAYVGPQA